MSVRLSMNYDDTYFAEQLLKVGGQKAPPFCTCCEASFLPSSHTASRSSDGEAGKCINRDDTSRNAKSVENS
jgi:hypothetical protein